MSDNIRKFKHEVFMELVVAHESHGKATSIYDGMNDENKLSELEIILENKRLGSQETFKSYLSGKSVKVTPEFNFDNVPIENRPEITDVACVMDITYNPEAYRRLTSCYDVRWKEHHGEDVTEHGGKMHYDLINLPPVKKINLSFYITDDEEVKFGAMCENGEMYTHFE